MDSRYDTLPLIPSSQLLQENDSPDSEAKVASDISAIMDLPVLFSDAGFNGKLIRVTGNISSIPDYFGGVSSLRMSRFSGFKVTLYTFPNFNGPRLVVTSSIDYLRDWNDKIQSLTLERRAKSTPERRQFLVVAQHLDSYHMPANHRAAALASSLAAMGHEVHVISQFGCVHPTFVESFDKEGIFWYCGEYNERLATTNPFDIVQLLQEHDFYATFMYLWFWYSLSVPELLIDSIRHFNPDCALLILTDDAHGEREHRLGSAFMDYQYLRPIHSQSLHLTHSSRIRNRELAIYQYSDMVVFLTESDQSTLEADLSVLGMVIVILHYT